MSKHKSVVGRQITRAAEVALALSDLAGNLQKMIAKDATFHRDAAMKSAWEI